MNEIRKDYFMDRYVIIAKNRGTRPKDFLKETSYRQLKKQQICFFCPGNESKTPPEIMREGDEKRWTMRVFPNKFPALCSPDLQIRQETCGDAHLECQPGCGRHEIIVETDEHSKQLWDLDPPRIRKLLEIYANRIGSLKREKDIRYVLVFKNSGRDAGISLEHSHTQLIALPFVPALPSSEAEMAKRYANEHKKCPFCHIAEFEASSKREIDSDENMFAFAPYASRFPLESWIMPKRHVNSICELSDGEKNSLAKMLKNILLKLKELNAPYNFFLHESPEGSDLHFHVEITPRLSMFGGFELGSDVVINTMPPEDAADYLRQK